MFAIQNAHGHLASVSEYKLFCERQLSLRDDHGACQIVEIDVVVSGPAPQPVITKGKARKRSADG